MISNYPVLSAQDPSAILELEASLNNSGENVNALGAYAAYASAAPDLNAFVFMESLIGGEFVTKSEGNIGIGYN